ncbi:Berberine bridge enzyme-like 18 [Linum grandiflorum]
MYFQLAATLLLFSFPWNDIVLASSSSVHENFIHCLSTSSAANVSKITFYTPSNPSYSSVLQFSIQNLRFINTSSASKPVVIVTPLTTSHVQSAVLCSKKHNLQLRIRGGGHDNEGLSYVALNLLPFFILDLINMSKVTVDVASKTAWVQGGATIGELYYQIGTHGNNTLAFPAGVGGGYGLLLRKFGLAADHIVDAQLIDVEGRVLNRASMGEDHFWAIRGGGGNTFGVVTAWKVKWQRVADILPDDLLIWVMLDRWSANIGRARFKRNFKGKSDYVVEPIPEHAFEGVWRRILRPEIEDPEMSFIPYGGRMSKISDSSIPFPHRAGNKFKIQHLIFWVKEGQEVNNRHISWVRELYGYLAPHVSKNPRAAYVNYRDLDLGMNNEEEGDKDEQEDWGVKYFKGNYKRLVRVKTAVDPMNFFRNEQSISPIYDD